LDQNETMTTAALPRTEPSSGKLIGNLSLGFNHQAGSTRLMRRQHHGPLLVQRPLYPEGSGCCHAIIVHPPGGIVGGDTLEIDVCAEQNAHTLLSTPGAAKWYRANGQVAHQRVHLRGDADASIEWLPQETIFFNQADVVLETQVSLHNSARFIGCEILCFGRTASGERFSQGQVKQTYKISVDDRLLWLEQGTLLADSASANGPLGLSGYSVCASLLCVGAPSQRALIDEVRAAIAPWAEPHAKLGATQMKSLLMVRYLGDASENARKVMLAAWRVLRPAMLGRASTELRIWNT
jgi:urease accessory protein